MTAKPLLYLIDGSSQMYRAFHAPIRTAEGGFLRNAQGRPTNAVYIFVTMLRKLLNEHKPEYIAASFDLPGRTFRDDLAADYKANRAPMPDELAEQIPMVHAACEALGVPILTSERYEADDVIGTLAVKAAAAGFDVAIVTMDKDFFQLVRDGIRVFNPRDEGTWYDAEGREGKVRRHAGPGRRRARADGRHDRQHQGRARHRRQGRARADRDVRVAREPASRMRREIKQKRYREALLANIDAARQSRDLARIHTDVPVEFDPEALRYRGASRQRCFEIFNELGVPHARRRVRADRRHDRQELPVRQHGGRRRATWPSRLRGRGRVRAARAAGPARPRCGHRSSASRFRRRRGTPTTCRSATAALGERCRRCRSRRRWHRCGRSSRTSGSARSATI